MFHTEGCINNIRDVILQHPLQGGVQVRVHRLDVHQVDGLVQQHLVERHREPTVNIMPVKHCNA